MIITDRHCKKRRNGQLKGLRDRHAVKYLQSIWIAVDVNLFVEKFDADCVEAFIVKGVAHVTIHQ